MKASYAALGIVCLALGGLWYVGGGSNISSQAAADELHVSAPIAHENLTVFFIHGPDTVLNAQIMTLQEAIESGRAIVHETGNVHELAVENLSSDYELFMQEGDIIRGGQQDRLIACDMLVPPRSGRVPFPCNCVEHGRWTGRGNEAATHFNKSDRFAVGQNLKIANIHRQQGEVWNSVEQQKKVISEATKVNVNSAISPSSLQLALENPAVKEKAAEYESTLKTEGETRQNVIGVVFLVNGEVSGVELYGSNALFLKAWPKLLRSAATEALAEKSEKPLQAPPSARDMERYLARVGQMEPQAADAVALQSPNPPPAGRVGRIIIEGNEVTADRVILRNPIGGGGSLASGGESSLASLATTPSITAPTSSGGNTRNTVSASNSLANYYANPNYQGILSNAQSNNNSPGGFGTPLFSPSRSSTGGGQINQPGAGVATGLVGQPGPSQPVAGVATPVLLQPQPASGTRLSVNRVENSSGVVSESRDPMRQDALIHKSFIKK